MKKIKCPCCGKELIRYEPFVKGIYRFWCDVCDVNIQVIDNKERKMKNE